MKNRKLFAIITLVAFMLTMMPIMAFAANPKATTDGSYIEVEDGTAKVNDAEGLEYTVYLDGLVSADDYDTFLVIYAERNGYYADDVTMQLLYKGNAITSTHKEGSYIVSTGRGASDYTLKITSGTAGTIVVRAFLVTDEESANVDAVTIASIVNNSANLLKQPLTGDGVTGKFNPTNTEISVTGSVENKDQTKDNPVNYNIGNNGTGEKTLNVNTYQNGKVQNAVEANNGVDYYEFDLQFYEGDSRLRGEDVDIYVNKIGATVNKETVTTNASGKVDFKVSATKPGTYIVTVECGNFSQDFKIEFTGTEASTPEFEFITDDTIAVDEKTSRVMEIVCYDGLGNKVTMSDSIQLQLVSVPEDSSLDTEEYIADNDANVTINRDNGKVAFKPDAVGSYRFKVYNTTTGIAAYATIDADEFGVVDHATISYPYANYALGATTGDPTVKLVDKAGVVKTVENGLSFSYAGTGVVKFDDGVITFSDDKDYAGQEVTVSVVVNGKYAASTSMTIGVKPAAINFTDAQGQAAKDITVTGQLVDLDGNNVALSASDKIEVQSAVVISRPEGAIVAVDTDDFNKDDEFIKKGVANIVVTSNKEGTVQANLVVAVYNAKVNNDGSFEMDGNEYTYEAEPSYYVAGVATVAVGEYTGDLEEANDIVTFIIGSSTFIANNKATTSDVAPYIVDGRTFIPVRAFVEATGATIEYDAATQVVTIVGDGVDAQMTIGSNILTVNGETVVMDTAAAIKDGRTVLPVRYAGQAIGYEFECAYGANGAVTAVTMFK